MLEVQNEGVSRVGSLEAWRGYYGLNFAPPFHLYVEVLIPSVTFFFFFLVDYFWRQHLLKVIKVE